MPRAVDEALGEEREFRLAVDEFVGAEEATVDKGISHRDAKYAAGFALRVLRFGESPLVLQGVRLGPGAVSQGYIWKGLILFGLGRARYAAFRRSRLLRGPRDAGVSGEHLAPATRLATVPAIARASTPEYRGPTPTEHADLVSRENIGDENRG